MSDYEDDEYDDYYLDGAADDWLYVEDAFDEADELAELTCPSPPYIADEAVDPYEYFIDLDYLSDAYFDDRADANIRRKGKQKLQERKRKRDTQGTSRVSNKRRRTAQHVNAESEAVRQPPITLNLAYVPQRARSRDPSFYMPTIDMEKVNLPTVALLKDWRKRFQGHRGLSTPPSNKANGMAGSMVSGGNIATVESIYEDAEDELSQQEDDDGDGFDLTDLKEVAGALNEDQLEALRKMLEAKGIDADALDVVMEDLLNGRPPEFEEEEAAAEDQQTHEEDVETSTATQHMFTSDQPVQLKSNGSTRARAGLEEEQPHKIAKRKTPGLMNFDDSDDNDLMAASASRSQSSKRVKGVAEPMIPTTTRSNDAGAKRKASDLDENGQGARPKRSKLPEAGSSRKSTRSTALRST